MNRHYSGFPERKLAKPPKAKDAPKGSTAAQGPVTDRALPWPGATPAWGTSFNRTTKMPVVKTRVVKHGVD